MKFVSIVVLTMSVLATLSARAEGPYATKGYRYRATYSQFDRGFHDHYGYAERRESCQFQYSNGWTSQTCFEIQPTEYVYVEERFVDGGYSRVAVYRAEHDATPYAEYYAYSNGGDRRVERRHFESSVYFHDDYYCDRAYYHETVWVSIDFNTWQGKMITGLEFAAIGTQIAAESRNEAGQVVGGTIAVLGSLSMSAGSQQAERESELQKSISEAAKTDGTNLN